MCDPVSASIMIAGMGASAWAGHNQTKAANRNAQAVQSAKEGKFREGLDRQLGYATEADKAFTPVIQGQGSDGFNDKLNTDIASRQQAFSSGRVSEPADYAVTDSTPGNVGAAREAIFKTYGDRTGRDNNNLATLGGYTGAGVNMGLDRNSYLRAFGNIADTASRDSNLIGLDMQQAANRAFKGPNAALSMIKQAGGMASMIGASGAAGGGNVGTAEAARQPGAPGNYGPQQGTFTIGKYQPFAPTY